MNRRLRKNCIYFRDGGTCVGIPRVITGCHHVLTCKRYKERKPKQPSCIAGMHGVPDCRGCRRHCADLRLEESRLSAELAKAEKGGDE